MLRLNFGHWERIFHYLIWQLKEIDIEFFTDWLCFGFWGWNSWFENFLIYLSTEIHSYSQKVVLLNQLHSLCLILCSFLCPMFLLFRYCLPCKDNWNLSRCGLLICFLCAHKMSKYISIIIDPIEKLFNQLRHLKLSHWRVKI